MLLPKVRIDIQLAAYSLLGDTHGRNLGSNHLGKAHAEQSIERILYE
jgi:hypothetical protein